MLSWFCGSGSAEETSARYQKTIFFHLPVASPNKDSVFLTGKGPYGGNVLLTVESPQSDESQSTVSSLNNFSSEKRVPVLLSSSELEEGYRIVDNWGEDFDKLEKSGSWLADTTVEIQVVARYWNEEFFDEVEFKKLERDVEGGGKEVGLGIYCPERRGWSSRELHFDITIRFPPSLSLLNYLYIFADNLFISTNPGTISSIEFNKLYFKTRNSGFKLFKLTSGEAIFETTNGSLTAEDIEVSKDLQINLTNGDINLERVHAKGQLKIRSTNGSLVGTKVVGEDGVFADVANGRVDFGRGGPHDGVEGREIVVKEKNGVIRGRFTVREKLKLTNANSSIDAEITLVDVKKADNPANVYAESTNGSVQLKYVQHPFDRELISFAGTTNGSCRVTHQPSFEGKFKVLGGFGSADVVVPHNPSDPAKRGRTRRFNVQKEVGGIGHKELEGKVWWQEEDSDDGEDRKGYTEARAQMGSVSIHFE